MHNNIITMRAAIFASALLAAGAVAAEAGTRIYVPTGDAAEALIIDAGSNRITGRIDGLPAAHGLAVTPDGRRLIVGSLMERAPGEAMPEKPPGMSAADHAAHHAPEAAAASAPAVSTVSVVDTETGEILRRIDVPGSVHHVSVSPDGRFAAVTHPGAGSITAIDLASLDIAATVKTGAAPNYAAFSKDGGTLYVSNSGDNEIAVIDTANWSLSGTIAVGESPGHLVIAPDGATLYVNNSADGTVSVIDLATGRVGEILAIGDTLHGIDLSDDGSTLFVADLGSEKIVAVNLGDGSVRSALLAPSPYHLMAVRGAGVLYVSSAGNPILRVVDMATLQTVDEIAISGTGHQMAQAGAH